jgi:hypothetical protein
MKSALGWLLLGAVVACDYPRPNDVPDVIACARTDQCPAMPCGSPECIDGACSYDPKPAGVADLQTAGDCKITMCDGAGNAVDAADDTDLPANTPCATASCASGSPTFTPLAANTTCTGSMICDGSGMCVECLTNAACSSGACNADHTCAAVSCAGAPIVVLSEVRSRGINGSTDEFVEIYNPQAADITLDNTWTIQERTTSGSTYGVRWTGSGTTLPSHHHYLIAGLSYPGAPVADAAVSGGFGDNSSLVLKHGGTLIDAVCYGGSTANFAGLTCEGTPFTINMTDVDVSIQRKPGAAGGNCVDHNDSSSDWMVTMPSQPQNVLSAPTP